MPTAIITGASAGIGAATAKVFQDAGYQLYNLSRRACPVDGVPAAHHLVARRTACHHTNATPPPSGRPDVANAARPG